MPERDRCRSASRARNSCRAIAPLRGSDDPNPFVAFRPYLAWDSFAAANGMTEDARDGLGAAGRR